jgi:hypothetical protein
MTVDALGIVAMHLLVFGIIYMRIICALSHAHFACDTFIRIADYLKFRFIYVQGHYLLSIPAYAYARGFDFKVAITGSPPRGDHTSSSSGAISRIADSSLAI